MIPADDLYGLFRDAAEDVADNLEVMAECLAALLTDMQEMNKAFEKLFKEEGDE